MMASSFIRRPSSLIRRGMMMNQQLSLSSAPGGVLSAIEGINVLPQQRRLGNNDSSSISWSFRSPSAYTNAARFASTLVASPYCGTDVMSTSRSNATLRSSQLGGDTTKSTFVRGFHKYNRKRKKQAHGALKARAEVAARKAAEAAGIEILPPPPPPPRPTPETSKYVVVQHGQAYEQQMEGYHGMTLQKALREGKGKDDPMFDPFMEDELLEQEILQGQMADEAAARNENGGAEGVDNDNDRETDDEEDEEDDEDDALEGLSEDAKANMTHEELTRVMYNIDGSIRRKASQKKILQAGSPAGGIYGVIEIAGSQYKVTHDDLLIINRLDPTKFTVGSIHALPEVMLVGTTHFTLIGMPYVRGATIHVMVEEITKDKKVIIFKIRRRKHSQRKRGFRRDVTMLRILDIQFPPDLDSTILDLENFVPRIEPDLLPPREDTRQRFLQQQEEEEGDEQGSETPRAAA